MSPRMVASVSRYSTAYRTRSAHGQHTVSTRSAHGQRTVSARSAHGQRTVNTRPGACGQHTSPALGGTTSRSALGLHTHLHRAPRGVEEVHAVQGVEAVPTRPRAVQLRINGKGGSTSIGGGAGKPLSVSPRSRPMGGFECETNKPSSEKEPFKFGRHSTASCHQQTGLPLFVQFTTAKNNNNDNNGNNNDNDNDDDDDNDNNDNGNSKRKSSPGVVRAAEHGHRVRGAGREHVAVELGAAARAPPPARARAVATPLRDLLGNHVVGAVDADVA